MDIHCTRRGAWGVKEKFLPVVREPWGVVSRRKGRDFWVMDCAPWWGRNFLQIGVDCASFMCNDSTSTH
jgi:hypothetical protein